MLLLMHCRVKVEVVSPDLPLHPTDALELVRHLCTTERPDLIVGSSCGAFYAQQVVRTEGIPALLINSFFLMSEFLEPRIGLMPINISVKTAFKLWRYPLNL